MSWKNQFIRDRVHHKISFHQSIRYHFPRKYISLKLSFTDKLRRNWWIFRWAVFTGYTIGWNKFCLLTYYTVHKGIYRTKRDKINFGLAYCRNEHQKCLWFFKDLCVFYEILVIFLDTFCDSIMYIMLYSL